MNDPLHRIRLQFTVVFLCTASEPSFENFFIVGILYFKQGAKNEASPIEKSMCDQFLDLVYVWYVKL